jgi:hypothetical protein
LGFVLAFLAMAAYVALRPASFRVCRVTVIRAPIEIVFFHVSDLREFNTWNPWMKMDPNVVVIYKGPPSGPGATFSWRGNASLGSGSMAVIECIPESLVRFMLYYERPFRGMNQAEILLRKEGGRVRVVWSIYGRSGFIPRLFSFLFFMNTDRLIGSILAGGLHDLKVIVENRR